MQSVLTFLGLNQTQRFMKERSPLFSKEFESRLSTFGLIPSDFYKTLSDNHCVIAGSFPLQVFLGETYENSDIDIFGIKVNTNGVNTYLSQFYTGVYQEYPDPKGYFGFDKGTNNFIICEVIKYTLPRITIQVISFLNTGQKKPIIHNTGDITSEFTFERFDFDFCKIAYDGSTLWIENPESLATKSCSVKLLRCTQKTIGRMEKYESRGFTFLNKEDILEYLNPSDSESESSDSLEIQSEWGSTQSNSESETVGSNSESNGTNSEDDDLPPLVTLDELIRST